VEEFKIELSKTDDRIEILMSGTMNERAQFEGYKNLKSSHFVIDTGGVTGINSAGIRSWINWIGTLELKAKITLKNCSKSFIDQANMVHSLLPAKTIIESFFVPFYNEDTGSEKHILYRRGTEYRGDNLYHPKEIKDENGNPMTMDAAPKYFAFLKRQPKD
jgi:hypothetical protein